MHTVAEFRIAYRRYVRRSMIGMLGMIVAAPVLAFGPVLFYGWLVAPPGVAPGEAMPVWMGVAGMIAFFVFLFGGMILLDRRLKRPTELSCPHCPAKLEAAGPILIATRCCHRCGRQALAEPDPSPVPDSPPRSRVEYAAIADRDDAVLHKLFWPLILALISPVVVMLPAALFRDTIREWLQPVADRDTLSTIYTALVILPMLAGVVWSVLVAMRLERRAEICPHCRKAHHPGLTATTGNCGQCGGQVVSFPPDEADGPLIPVEAAVASGRKLSRAAWWRIRLGLAVGFGLMIVLGVIFGEGRRERYVADLEQRYGIVEAAVIEVVVVVVAVFAIFGGIWSALRLTATPIGVRCPHCATPVGGAGLTIASKRCTKCFRRIIADPELMAITPA